MAPVDSIRQRPARRPAQRATEYSGDPVRAYLNGIGKHRLLTASEEVECAKAIEAGLMAECRISEVTDPDFRSDLARVAAEGRASGYWLCMCWWHRYPARARLRNGLKARSTFQTLPVRSRGGF